jgi:hypothetical protein
MNLRDRFLIYENITWTDILRSIQTRRQIDELNRKLKRELAIHRQELLESRIEMLTENDLGENPLL